MGRYGVVGIDNKEPLFFGCYGHHLVGFPTLYYLELLEPNGKVARPLFVPTRKTGSTKKKHAGRKEVQIRLPPGTKKGNSRSHMEELP